MKTTEPLSVLHEFHRDKLALRNRHVAVAQLVSDYEFNNAYQYVIAREDVHLQWIEAALTDLGAVPTEAAAIVIPPRGKKESFMPLVVDDARTAAEFVTSWRARLPEVTNARNRTMMQVVLGESLEHKRFFEQMMSGRDDLLGRRSNGPGSPGTGDGVMPVRWVE
ncbi:MAG: ferritin-like domain-containing protein [Acidobacteriota bacterium]